MGISVTDPIGQAIDRANRMLFKPFNATNWFTLGFAAFLAYLGEGAASNFSNGNPFGGWGGGGGGGWPTDAETLPEFLDELKQLFLRHAHWVVPAAFVLLLLGVLILWLRARGKFVFLDGVARNHAAISEPWKRLRAPADSFFRFDLLLLLLLWLGLVGIGYLSYRIALPDLRAARMGPAAVTAIVTGVSLLLLLMLVYLLICAVAEDFLIPLMYLRAQPVGPAWHEFRSRVLRGHVGAIALFYLMRVVLGIGIATIATIGTCVTCCIAALPYVSSVVFLPLFVFSRSYSLYFLRQFDGEYNFMAEADPVPVYGFPVVMDPSQLPPPLPLPHDGTAPVSPPPLPTTWPPPPPPRLGT